LLACALIGCGANPPEIARDLPRDYAQGERVFEDRLKQRFPISSNEADLVAELMRQGFEMKSSRDARYANFSDDAFPVTTVWRIIWKASDGKITEISGIRYGVGL
jgi:hypothetical protein